MAEAADAAAWTKTDAIMVTLVNRHRGKKSSVKFGTFSPYDKHGKRKPEIQPQARKAHVSILKAFIPKGKRK